MMVNVSNSHQDSQLKYFLILLRAYLIAYLSNTIGGRDDAWLKYFLIMLSSMVMQQYKITV